jgi:NADP-dependent 3-hydroxy acid dehydrogenase YdfG
MDVIKEDDWKKALGTAKSKYGTLDILVNNAGWTYKRKDSLTVTEREYDRQSFLREQLLSETLKPCGSGF